MSEITLPCAAYRHIDPLAYLVDKEADEFENWKAHFPECPECRAALAELSELEWQLGELESPHPDAVELDAYALGHGLDDAQQSRIDAHVAECPICSDQLRSLARFESARAGSTVEVAGATGLVRDGGPISRTLEAISEWLRPVPVPVWAGSLAVLLVTVYSLLPGPAGEESTTPPRLAERAEEGVPDPIGSVDPVPEREVSPPESSGPPTDVMLAESDASPPPEELLEDPVESGGRAPHEIAETAPLAPDESVLDETPRPEILLAALDLPGVIDYGGSGVGPGRVDVLGRGAQNGGATATPIQLLAPREHRGLSATTSGLLVWALANERTEPLRLVIVDERQIDPTFEIAIAGPHVAGIHALDLAAYGIALESGVEYVWSVAIEIDPDRPSRSPRSRAVLDLLSEEAAAKRELAAATPDARIGTALRHGLWYDALSDLGRAAATPRADAQTFRNALRDLALAEGVAVDSDAPLTVHAPFRPGL